jgi:hypothetical protein
MLILRPSMGKKITFPPHALQSAPVALQGGGGGRGGRGTGEGEGKSSTGHECVEWARTHYSTA